MDCIIGVVLVHVLDLGVAFPKVVVYLLHLVIIPLPVVQCHPLVIMETDHIPMLMVIMPMDHMVYTIMDIMVIILMDISHH